MLCGSSHFGVIRFGVFLEASRIGSTQPCTMEAAADDEKESGEQSEREEAEWNANQASADYLLSKGFIEGYSDDLLGQEQQSMKNPRTGCANVSASANVQSVG